MEIKEETLDQMIAYLAQFKGLDTQSITIVIGEYRGFKVCVALEKPDDD